MQNAQNIIIKALEVFPNTEPKEITLSIRDMITTLDNIGRIGHTRPFGGAAINVNCTVEGMQSGQPFNRTIIDGNGAQTIDAYGVFYVSWRGHVPTPDEIAMYKHLFSLEECAKPIEERIKTIKEYFPSGVEGVLMPARSQPEIYHSPHRHAVVHTAGHSFTHPRRPRQKQRLHPPLPDLRLARYRKDNLGAEGIRRFHVRAAQQDGKIAIQVQ